MTTISYSPQTIYSGVDTALACSVSGQNYMDGYLSIMCQNPLVSISFQPAEPVSLTGSALTYTNTHIGSYNTANGALFSFTTNPLVNGTFGGTWYSNGISSVPSGWELSGQYFIGSYRTGISHADRKSFNGGIGSILNGSDVLSLYSTFRAGYVPTEIRYGPSIRTSSVFTANIGDVLSFDMAVQWGIDNAICNCILDVVLIDDRNNVIQIFKNITSHSQSWQTQQYTFTTDGEYSLRFEVGLDPGISINMPIQVATSVYVGIGNVTLSSPLAPIIDDGVINAILSRVAITTTGTDDFTIDVSVMDSSGTATTATIPFTLPPKEPPVISYNGVRDTIKSNIPLLINVGQVVDRVTSGRIMCNGSFVCSWQNSGGTYTIVSGLKYVSLIPGDNVITVEVQSPLTYSHDIIVRREPVVRSIKSNVKMGAEMSNAFGSPAKVSNKLNDVVPIRDISYARRVQYVRRFLG